MRARTRTHTHTHTHTHTQCEELTESTNIEEPSIVVLSAESHVIGPPTKAFNGVSSLEGDPGKQCQWISTA